MQNIDLIIIGSGPAGVSTALHLLPSDPCWAGRMLLLEKAAHPHPKLCGGAITRLGIEGHLLHWFSPRNCLAIPRLLLTGDAAGVDGLFGGGIAPALAYGQIAAQAVQEAFAREDFSFSHYRQRVLRSQLGQYLLVRWCVAWWGYHFGQIPWFMHLVWTLGMVASNLWPQPEPLLQKAIDRPLAET